jgi:hypothetical protein
MIIVAKTLVVDWWQVITDLAVNGKYTTRQLSRMLGRTKAYIPNLRNQPAHSPKHEDGEALIELWCKVMGKDRSEIPRKKREPTISEMKRWR